MTLAKSQAHILSARLVRVVCVKWKISHDKKCKYVDLMCVRMCIYMRT